MTGSVLFLTHEPPVPAVSGGRVRTSHLIRELDSRGWSVSLFCLDGSDGPASADLPGIRALVRDAVVVPFGRPRGRRVAGAAADFLRGRGFQAGWYLDPLAAERLRDWLARESFDAIVVGQLYMLAYVPAALLDRTVLDCWNVEEQRVASMAAAQGLTPRGLTARLQVAPVRRTERAAVRAVARVLAVSEAERAHFERLAPGHVTLVSNGADVRGTRVRSDVPAGAEILFVGTLRYSANVDAALELIRMVLPLVRDPRVRLTIVGDEPPPSIREAAATAGNVEVTGRVADTAPYFARARALVVPLRFGGGTRLKILEALARGVPVITTAVGGEGLGLVDGHDALIAADHASLASSIDRVLADDALCVALATHGRQTAERFDWRHSGDALARALDQIVGRT
jgi:glycosyltransferase involved in cell wall biosynthesis